MISITKSFTHNYIFYELRPQIYRSYYILGNPNNYMLHLYDVIYIFLTCILIFFSSTYSFLLWLFFSQIFHIETQFNNNYEMTVQYRTNMIFNSNNFHIQSFIHSIFFHSMIHPSIFFSFDVLSFDDLSSDIFVFPCYIRTPNSSNYIFGMDMY